MSTFVWFRSRKKLLFDLVKCVVRVDRKTQKFRFELGRLFKSEMLVDMRWKTFILLRLQHPSPAINPITFSPDFYDIIDVLFSYRSAQINFSSFDLQAVGAKDSIKPMEITHSFHCCCCHDENYMIVQISLVINFLLLKFYCATLPICYSQILPCSLHIKFLYALVGSFCSSLHPTKEKKLFARKRDL